MHAYLHCLSHTPLVGFVDPEQAVLDEVNGVIADARRRIAEFDPELVVLFAPDHYNGFFYDVMPPFCLGVGATAIGDFASAAGDLPVPAELAEACAHRHPQQRYRPGGVVQHAGGPWLRPAAGVSAGWPGPRAGAAGVY
ncbi:2,3-dihydroxyphenylpropionate 1,2-dioxygenase [Klebsiella pneumoniae]|nr:2,3-dihydroxyphenylpropionate 1,2-dioxygenase [Klebsiella pneumoniae]